MKPSTLPPTSGIRTSTMACTSTRAPVSMVLIRAVPVTLTGAPGTTPLMVPVARPSRTGVQVSSRTRVRSPLCRCLTNPGSRANPMVWVVAMVRPSSSFLRASSETSSQPDFASRASQYASSANAPCTSATLHAYSAAMSYERGMPVTLPLASVAGTKFAGAAVAENVSLATRTTLRIGPVAQRLITCDTTDTLAAVLSALPVGDDVLVLAGGSNVVLADDLTGLTVVAVGNTAITVDGAVLRAEAGARWDDVVAAALAHGLGGLECLSGIPGSAGATPIQNVGAYGAEVADTISRVRLLDRTTGTDEWVGPDRLGFGYRHSVLKYQSAIVVLEVEFTLDPGGRSAPLRYGELATKLGVPAGQSADPVRVREAVLALRAAKGMVLDAADHDTWSVGSFFTNPVVEPEVFERLRADTEGAVPHYPAPDGVKLAAGWLVEQSGFGKGYPGPAGPARLSTKHALAMTNRGAATSADLIALARTVRDGVRSRFGIELTPEPVLIGCAL